MLTNLQKRYLLFLIFCIGSRVAFVFLAKYLNLLGLKIMGIIAGLIGIGFLMVFFFKLRETGRETFGTKIWWDALRPFHALTYLTFAYLAIKGIQEHAWKVLLLDVLVGLGAFLIHHSKD